MGYITTERVKEIRNKIKQGFPKFKFSITREHHSTVNIDILESPIDLLPDKEKKYEQVNCYYIREHYENYPEIKDILLKINDIANDGVKYHETGDYGFQPSFYVNISIGRWDKPLKIL
jgi:hypothetical protein